MWFHHRHDKAAVKSSSPALSSMTGYKFLLPFYADVSVLVAKNWPIFGRANRLTLIHAQSDE